MQEHRKTAAGGVEGAWYRGSYPPFLIPQPLRLTLHYVSRSLYYPTNHTFLSVQYTRLHRSCRTAIKVWALLFLIKLSHVWVGIIPIILSAGKIWAGAFQQHLRITKHFKRLSILPTDCFERRLHWRAICNIQELICTKVVSFTFIYHSLVNRNHWEVVMTMPLGLVEGIHWLLCCFSFLLHQFPFWRWHAKN